MNFKPANLDFVATSIKSLVISGSKGILRRVGTLNGSGNYTFLVAGIDGSGGQGLIRFQIKDSSGNVVYDTQPGASDIADPTTNVIGTVVVH
jgi:hypothetical protein